MAQAFRWLQIETAHSQKDVLGHLYESQITLGRQGQFFTPHQLFRAIADMLSEKAPGEEEKIENVHDPACGSGRAFILMAQQNLDKQYYFVGIDISPVMARIAAINMWLFDLNAEIWQGNSLSMELSYVWQIRKGGWIWESKVIGENGQVDGTVAAWLEEYDKNHPPLPEEQRQAILADYERWEKVLRIIHEMEAQFKSPPKEEQPVTAAAKEDTQASALAPESIEPNGIVFETWVLPEQTAASKQAQLFSDLPPVKEKPARTKKKAQKQTDPVQYPLYFPSLYLLRLVISFSFSPFYTHR